MPLMLLLKSIPRKFWLILGVVLAFLLLFGYANHERALVTAVQFEKDSVEAVSDTTKRFLSGHYALFQRRAIQTKLELDSVNKASKTVPKVRTVATVTVSTVHDTVAIPLQRDDTLFKMSFTATKKPYTLDATIVGNLIQQTADVDFTVSTEPFKLNMRLDCGDEVNGVRPALVGLGVPDYVTVSLDTVRQSKEVCSPRSVRADIGSSVKQKVGLVGLGVALGVAAVRFFHNRSK